MEYKRDPRGQGDLGERSAIIWLMGKDASVFMPIGHSRDIDLIAVWDGGPAVRVQVKTSAQLVNQRWHIAVCTRGGNQSWNGLVKRLDPEKYGYLFVHVGDGRRWFIPSLAVEGGTQIVLGGTKYAEYEIESGAPLPAHLARLETSAQR